MYGVSWKGTAVPLSTAYQIKIEKPTIHCAPNLLTSFGSERYVRAKRYERE